MPDSSPNPHFEASAEEAGSGHQRHRERRRRNRAADEPSGAQAAEAAEVPEPKDVDRALRGLVGAGPSQLTLSAAMRARDSSQPTPEDLAEVEAELKVIRRQYVPTESLPAGVRPAPRTRRP
jgi:hypothetical protein